MNPRNLGKVSGLALLAMVAVMSVGASGAQAKWLLLKNFGTVSELNLNGNVSLTQLLVPKLSLTIHCTGASARARIWGGGTTNLNGIAHALFGGCTVSGFTSLCVVHSKGAANGFILVEGIGSGTMTGEETTLALNAASFTFIEILGALCPISETSATVSGSTTLTFLESAKNTKDHLAHLDDNFLLYGKNSAALDGFIGDSLADFFEDAGGTWSIGLTGL